MGQRRLAVKEISLLVRTINWGVQDLSFGPYLSIISFQRDFSF